MYHYFISIGSNIRPRQNIPRALEAILHFADLIAISRIVKTQPVGLKSKHQFLNLVACISTDMDRVKLKQKFNQIETNQGRDRTAPNKKISDRTIDLDIIFHTQIHQMAIASYLFPSEPYVRPMLVELVHFLGLECAIEPDNMPLGTPISFQGAEIGRSVHRFGKHTTSIAPSHILPA